MEAEARIATTGNPYGDRWKVMTAVGAGVLLATVDGSIVNVALPTLVRALDTRFSVVQWVILGYLLTLTVLLLTVGRLADILGKKPLYNSGFAVFTIGSVLCGISPNVELLIASRILQGIGASMILALGPAIVTEAFPARERGRALGVIGSIVSIGIVIGPALGGFLVETWSWHWIFFVNIPVGIAGMILVWRFVPSLRAPGGQRFDIAGALVFSASLLSLLLALTLGQTRGFTAPVILELFSGFVVSGAVFVWIELHVAQPMIAPRLFRSPVLATNLFTGLVTFVCAAGILLLVPFYLENVLAFDPRRTGLLMSAVPVALGISAPLSGIASDRFGSRPLTVIGLAVLVLAYLGLRTVDATTGMLGFVLRFAPVGLGMGLFQSPNNSAIMGTAAPRELGVVSGLLAITRTLGQTTGIAIIGALWAARTLARGAGQLGTDATEAAPGAQVHGLQDTLAVVTALLGIALLVGIWAWARERRRNGDVTADLSGRPSP
ncbi:MAG: MFS transporter [Candidatus Eisenbacteria bacterium]